MGHIPCIISSVTLACVVGPFTAEHIVAIVSLVIQ